MEDVQFAELHTPLEEDFTSTSEARYVIPALVLATGCFSFILLAGSYVVWGSRQIPHCKRFPLLFFGVSFFGFAMMMTEAVVYILMPRLQSCYYIWILYVLGRPMSFLPVGILAWRLRLIYMGEFSFRQLRWVSPCQQMGVRLGDRWIWTRLIFALIPYAMCYPFIVLFGDWADSAHVFLQAIGLLFMLVIILQLFSIKSQLKTHALDQTWMLLAFWCTIVGGTVYANMSWYAFRHFNNIELSMSILLAVLSFQSIVVFVLWYTNFRITLRRALAKQSTLPSMVALTSFGPDGIKDIPQAKSMTTINEHDGYNCVQGKKFFKPTFSFGQTSLHISQYFGTNKHLNPTSQANMQCLDEKSGRVFIDLGSPNTSESETLSSSSSSEDEDHPTSSESNSVMKRISAFVSRSNKNKNKNDAATTNAAESSTSATLERNSICITMPPAAVIH